MATREPAIGDRQSFAWHGWQLAVPREWNPVRIEGDWRSGFVLFADLHRPRLGLRWGVVRDARLGADEWARRAIRAEIGQLAARDARPLTSCDAQLEASKIYLEPELPGRDVWVGFSRASGRGVELIYHATRRDSFLADTIVPRLADHPLDRPMPWAVFDLRCVAPAGMKLKSHQLAAGDLRLNFSARHRFASLRQIAVATLALSRMPLEKWLAHEQRTRSLHYRANVDARDTSHHTEDGRQLRGFCGALTRRRRFFFMPWLPRELLAAALHDESRDRLVLVQASDGALLEALVRTVGADDRVPFAGA